MRSRTEFWEIKGPDVLLSFLLIILTDYYIQNNVFSPL